MTPRERAVRLVKQAKREPYYSELEAEVARLRLALAEGHRNGWIAGWLHCNPTQDITAAQNAYLDFCAALEGK